MSNIVFYAFVIIYYQGGKSTDDFTMSDHHYAYMVKVVYKEKTNKKSIFSVARSDLTTTIHQTAAAKERVNNLWCYNCDSMDDGESCIDVTHNDSVVMQKCIGEEFICMVKRFSYTTSTENSTSAPKMWSLNRRCTVNCEPGCIIIGERTKLYACTSCCEESLCNTGRGAASRVCDRVETGIGTRIWFVLLLPHFLSTYH